MGRCRHRLGCRLDEKTRCGPRTMQAHRHASPSDYDRDVGRRLRRGIRKTRCHVPGRLQAANRHPSSPPKTPTQTLWQNHQAVPSRQELGEKTQTRSNFIKAPQTQGLTHSAGVILLDHSPTGHELGRANPALVHDVRNLDRPDYALLPAIRQWRLRRQTAIGRPKAAMFRTRHDPEIQHVSGWVANMRHQRLCRSSPRGVTG